ncbi:response regulator [Chamaesiphon sp. VAR_69_metabat_338]|uniref:response regulator n=1 Tax=Chamaesiphon sp. VAR_69_metabat_338 TaxID=2964704 RepID=UPI00286E8D71|nr:response regulator [Chamaesiphon sp. VAR_69_metabat_338]
MKILVVEDDVLVADLLRMTLSERNYAVEVVHDGQAGMDCIEAFDYDLLLLDAILPKLDGISICRHVRSRGYLMPILLLTSKDSKHDRAMGLDAGADDYVVKPFDPEELSARIRALLRRGNDRVQTVLTWENLTLSPCNYEVTYQNQLLNLTPKEYALLELFLRHNRQLFSCGAILEHLWTYEDVPSEEAVRTHIKGLRHKLRAAGAPADLVETVYGIGYRLKASDPESGRQQQRSGRRQSSGADRLVLANGAVETANPEPIETAQIDRPLSADVCAPVREIEGKIEHKSAVSNTLAAEAGGVPQFLTAIWNRYRPQTLDRLASIERASLALQLRSLTPEIRQQAWQSAHNLAGSLGTFGFPLGSQAAKQIELLLDEKTELTWECLSQLQCNVAVLQQEIAKPAATIAAELTSVPCQLPWLLAIVHESTLATSLSFAAQQRFEIVREIALAPDRLAQQPQLVILDLDCFASVDDGLAALSELDRDYPQIPVVVLSQPHPDLDDRSLGNPTKNEANGLHHRIEAARRGARLFLAKPLPASQILRAVDRVLQQAHASQARVTIVDDDRLLLEGVSSLLSARGMKVTTLSEPSRFWETLEASAPDLLILDLDMPTHDGIELCRAVRTDPHWASLPILFLTAHTAALASDRVFAAGADDFVTKPASDATLVTRIVNRLERIGRQ